MRRHGASVVHIDGGLCAAIHKLADPNIKLAPALDFFQRAIRPAGIRKELEVEMQWIASAVVIVVMISASSPALAQNDAAELAKKLANPVSSLISLPIQANYDQNIGVADEGSVWRINIQPVIPVTLSADWNLISRTILPVIFQNDVPISGMGENGIGDIVQSFFFSPARPVAGRWIMGVGPVVLLPTASKDVLGTEKWGAGPTIVALQQVGPWTYGFLANHIWSFAGKEDRADMNATFLQPFLAIVTKTKTTVSINTESTYDWENEAWSVPINMGVAQLLKVGPQILQLGVGARYWANSPEGAAEGWGFRGSVTFLFPK